jgi:RsiW-degrading membrane proteinase PrsW (M82 family)
MATTVDTHRRTGLSIFAAVVAFSAYAGALGLATGALSIGDALTARLPFGSPVLGGIALALVVGIPTTLVAGLAWVGDERTDAAALVAGVLLVGWIVVEYLFIRELSFFQPTYVVVGAVLMWLGRGALSQTRA